MAETTTQTVIPQTTPWQEHTRCSHGLNSTIGYVVAYSHLSGNEVTFTDIGYVQGSTNYGLALGLVHEARAKVRDGEVDAVYAVIHTVYEGDHRPV